MLTGILSSPHLNSFARKTLNNLFQFVIDFQLFVFIYYRVFLGGRFEFK